MADKGVQFRREFAEQVKLAVDDWLRRNPPLPRTEGTRRPIPHDYSFRIGVLQEDIDQGDSGDVTIYEGTTKGSETASDITVEAYNRFGDLSDGQQCIILFIDGGWEIIAAGCE